MNRWTGLSAILTAIFYLLTVIGPTIHLRQIFGVVFLVCFAWFMKCLSTPADDDDDNFWEHGV